jgi:hypothetical protein
MPTRPQSRRDGLAGSLLVIAVGLLTLGLFVVALLAAPPVDAKTSRSRDYGARWEERDERSFQWSERMSRGQTLEVRGINGRIQVEAASGNVAEVEAVKSWKRSDPEDVRIEVNESAEGYRICALYRKSNGDWNTDCESQSVNRNDVVVNYTVRVPPGVHVAVQTVNGEVNVEDVRGDVDAATVNGSIRLSTTGVASATTVNGSIHARIGEGDWNGGLQFETVNGSIDLIMPANVNADLSARSMNGSVKSDFPITTTGRITTRRLNGTIGGGGPRLSLGTINGAIELRMDDRRNDRRGD